MKKNLLITLLFLFLLSPFKLVSQEVFSHTEAGVQLTIPGGWFYEQEANNITFYPKDKDFVVSITIHEVTSIDKIIDALIADLSKSYTSIDISDPKEDNINGLEGWEIHGTAKSEGVDVSIDYGIYATPNEKIMEIGVVAAGDIIEKYKKDIEVILNGIKPID